MGVLVTVPLPLPARTLLGAAVPVVMGRLALLVTPTRRLAAVSLVVSVNGTVVGAAGEVASTLTVLVTVSLPLLTRTLLSAAAPVPVWQTAVVVTRAGVLLHRAGCRDRDAGGRRGIRAGHTGHVCSHGVRQPVHVGGQLTEHTESNRILEKTIKFISLE